MKKNTVLPELYIGEKIAQVPIIQGGMGVGVSLSRLAGTVAAEGGIGVISTAQIGYREADFQKDPSGCNLEAIRKNIHAAKKIADGKGLVGVNVMHALKHYKEHVRAAVAAGADVVICGAGLPVDLPELTAESDAKIAPIISSARACRLILKMWDHKYHKTADFVVAEGPMAGGHLGFSKEQLVAYGFTEKGPAEHEGHRDRTVWDCRMWEQEIEAILSVLREYEQQYQRNIPLILAGGIYDHADILHALELGASGVQIASRFVATKECDAADAYKQAYVDAKESDICLIESPVGMPGRAINNFFAKRTREQREPICHCYQCLEKCDPTQVPYCITKALIDAVKGDIENGLLFCGENVDRIDRIVSVHELMQELCDTKG